MKKGLKGTGIVACIIFLFLLFIYSPVFAAAEGITELNYATDTPAFPPTVKTTNAWIEGISKRTNGKVKITVYYSGSLARGKDMRRSVVKGVVDIGTMTLSHDLSAFPLNAVVMLPVLGIPDRNAGSQIWNELLEKFPEMKAEYKGTKVLINRVDLPHTLHGVKKRIQTPADIQKLKIASFGIGAKILEAMGASPVALMPGDVYMGLERGVAEGGLATYNTARMLRILDLFKYHNTTVLNWFGIVLIMNEKKFNSLPPKFQKVIEEESSKLAQGQSDMAISLEESARKVAVEKKHTFINNSPEEVKDWHDSVRPYQDKWIAENEAKGLPAKAVYEETLKLIKKYSK